jgi:hypothetical protein
MSQRPNTISVQAFARFHHQDHNGVNLCCMIEDNQLNVNRIILTLSFSTKVSGQQRATLNGTSYTLQKFLMIYTNLTTPRLRI